MKTTAKQTVISKPYAMLGAGQLVSGIWKSGDEQSGWAYRFNVYRTNPRTGHVSQLLRPADVPDLVKLCQVLAATLADDGCIAVPLRRAMARLAAELDSITQGRT
jgi:hypothetical protein